jgi:hypothetical protein
LTVSPRTTLDTEPIGGGFSGGFSGGSSGRLAGSNFFSGSVGVRGRDSGFTSVVVGVIEVCGVFGVWDPGGFPSVIPDSEDCGD